MARGTTETVDPSLSPLGRALRWRRPTWDDHERRAVLDELFYEGPERGPFLARFASLIVLSTLIAGLGLVGDSAAVVIGAMLVAPLMTPILAVAGAAVHGQVDRLATSAGILVGGTVAAVATGWVVGWLAGGILTVPELTGQLLARTTPGLVDLGVAIAAGLAGGYVLTHPRAGGSLPGVAIAVALVPPLATVGICLRLDAIEQARGAMLLYATNMFAIILSAMVVMLVTGFVPDDVRLVARGRVRVGLVVALVSVVAVAVPLTTHTVEIIVDQRYTSAVLSAVEEWDPGARVLSVEVDAGADVVTVDLVVATTGARQPAWRLAELVAVGSAVPVDVTVEYRVEQRDQATAG